MINYNCPAIAQYRNGLAMGWKDLVTGAVYVAGSKADPTPAEMETARQTCLTAARNVLFNLSKANPEDTSAPIVNRPLEDWQNLYQASL